MGETDAESRALKHKARGIRVLVVVVLVFLGIRIFMGRPAPKPAVFEGATDLPTAMALSMESGRPVLAFVTADWCEPCQELKRGALADEGVLKWIKDNTHPVYIDATDANEDAARLNVTTIPVLIGLRADGTAIREVSRLGGVVGKKDLLEWLAAFSGPVQDYKAQKGEFPEGYEAKK